MARRKQRFLKAVLGILIGVFTSHLFTSGKLATHDMCMSPEKRYVTPVLLVNEENARASNKNLLFVGIMTAAKYLDTRAKAVYDTWGREVPGRVMFYSSGYSYSEHVPLIPLSDVDDSYPPQKKSFMMLKHMHDNYIDQYEWFLRADDDVYIRTDRLEKLLRSVDSKKAWFIGQTGRGNSEEFGLLSLENDENFCMGGPGVILSRETLKRMAPYVDDCLEHLYTTHEDVELGRCVRRFAGISCTWSYEASDSTSKMQVILYHNKSGEAAFTGNLKQKEVHRAITLHPVKQPKSMNRLHRYVKGLKIQKGKQESILLHRDIAASMSELGYRVSRIDVAELVKNLPLFPNHRGSDGYLGDTNILGIPTSINRYTPHSLSDVLEWELICKTLYSHRDLNPRKRINSSLKEGLSDVVREVMELINSFSKQRGRVIDFKEILYGYWRVDPIYGVDLILDLLLVYRKYRGHKMTVQVRRHAYIQQTFTGMHVKEINVYEFPTVYQKLPTAEPLAAPRQIVNQLFSKLSENLQPILSTSDGTKRIYVNFILPLSGRHIIFKRFMEMYEYVCLREDEPARLHVILYKNRNSPNDFYHSQKLIEDVKAKYRHNDIRIIYSNDTFTRGKALQLGVNSLSNDDDLMLFIDVDMIFDRKSLERIRRNTMKNEMIYFPIIYSLYNPSLLNKSYVSSDYSTFDGAYIVDEINGFWRQFGFGIVALYKSDYLNLGGFDLMISGWGYEDVTFYDNAIKSNLVRIVRTVDPGLVHVFHSVECDIGLDVEQKNMCMGTKASTLGSVRQLQHIFLKYKNTFR